MFSSEHRRSALVIITERHVTTPFEIHTTLRSACNQE